MDGNRASGGSITRRGLCGTIAAAGAALAPVSTAVAAEAGGIATKVDVVVAGAGFAGLSAALTVVRAGRSVVLLEARDRVGGRVVNKSIGGGEVLEAGGQYIGPTQNLMARLTEQFDVETYPTHSSGKQVVKFGGVRSVGGFPPALEREYATLVGRLNAMSRTVPVDARGCVARLVGNERHGSRWSWLVGSGSEVKLGRGLGEALPAVDLAQGDLA